MNTASRQPGTGWAAHLRHSGFCIAALALLVSAPSLAQQPAYGVDLRKDSLLKRQERNRTIPSNEFGDQHGLESGSLTFNVVDVDIPGNSKLSVEFRRILVATDPVKQFNSFSYGYPQTRLGDWAIGLPKIEATYSATAGWITSDTAQPTKNCSITQAWLMEPPPGEPYPDAFRAHMFWNPPTVHYPDGSSGLLVYNSAGMPLPSSGGPYRWVTTSHDAASCITTLKNRNTSAPAGSPERIFGQGEGYLVVRPDGTKYWFDWMALESSLPVSNSALNYCAIGPFGCEIQLMEVSMQLATLALYPTRIEDRFGNWVTYTYSNKTNELVKLDRIESNDGRLITLGYSNGYLSSVNANGRAWSYTYNSANVTANLISGQPLAEVRNPDGTNWRYWGTSHPPPPNSIQRPCENLAWTQTVNPDATTVADTDFGGYTVDSPSGARAVFRVDQVILGRSAVTDGCYAPGAVMPGSNPTTVPRRFLGGYRRVLTGKKVTGPALTPMIWKYSYQSNIGFAPMANGTTRTKVLGPDGALDTYTFGNTYTLDEGLLLAHTRAASPQAQPLQSETHTYATGTAISGFPKLIGFHPDARDRVAATFLRPKLSTTKVLQATRFRWAVDTTCSGRCLDTLGRPTRVTRSSAPNP
ncbi:hypothetical protein FZO89_07760 [Luteimonas viscosa]|uniref:YD repeat-containing protein n=2 Tax=Luteimonas viscosa TaxID=1132694 RepID=A0A5D4XQC9_9GAMM|nr:hypothetical protein FZO89_07760 [Luteimonas viscosa]